MDPAPIDGVIFDFHATLVDTRDPGSWLATAQQRLSGPAKHSPAELDAIGTHLYRVWEHATTFDPHSERDLSPARHREVFGRAIALHPGTDPDLIDALYAVMPQQWIAFADTLPVLRALKVAGRRVVVLSNTGLDIRPCLDDTGITDLVDGVVLSYEVASVKPQPEIFRHALDVLQIPAERTLMVGDSWRDDAGAAGLGIRTLILPRTTGPTHGLDAVLRLIG